MSNRNFKGMSFLFKIRDFFRPPMKKVLEANLQPGFRVLDYGCGPGSYTIAATELVGESGKIYAADIHPLAMEKVKKAALKKGFSNIETIQTDCKTGLQDKSIDVVLMYDVYHTLSDRDCVMKELHRVLKPNGILAFDDHHLKEEDLVPTITKQGLFKLSEKKKKTYHFTKIEQ